MSITAQEVALSLFSRWEMDAEIHNSAKKGKKSTPKEFTSPKEFTTPKPKPKMEDDGFTLVKKGVKPSKNTTVTKVQTVEAYNALPIAKATVTTPVGTGKAFKKNMKRKAKKAQKAV